MKMIFTLKELWECDTITNGCNDPQFSFANPQELRDLLWQIPQECRMMLGIEFSYVTTPNTCGKQQHWEISFEGNMEGLRRKYWMIENSLEYLHAPDAQLTDEHYDGEAKDAEGWAVMNYVTEHPDDEDYWGTIPLTLLGLMIDVVAKVNI